MSAVLTPLVAGALGLGVGHLVNRIAGRFPWSAGGGHRLAVRPPLVELGTAALFALTGVHFGWSWELPAFLFLAGVAVLLAVIDLQHQLLPNRVVLPAIGIGAGAADRRRARHGRLGGAAARRRWAPSCSSSSSSSWR